MQPFTVVALADQQVAKSLIKYIDNNKASDLSNANKSIERAKEGFLTIVSNRAKLFSKAGLSEEEIKNKATEMEEELSAYES